MSFAPGREGPGRRVGILMRKVGMAVAAAVVVLLASACSSGSDDGDSGDGEWAYGARSCSYWAGQMSESERWAAAEELLASAKSSDGTEGDKVPSTSVIRQFATDLGTMCERGASDDLLATVADDLYESNRAFYTL